MICTVPISPDLCFQARPGEVLKVSQFGANEYVAVSDTLTIRVRLHQPVVIQDTMITWFTECSGAACVGYTALCGVSASGKDRRTEYDWQVVRGDYALYYTEIIVITPTDTVFNDVTKRLIFTAGEGVALSRMLRPLGVV